MLAILMLATTAGGGGDAISTSQVLTYALHVAEILWLAWMARQQSRTATLEERVEQQTRELVEAQITGRTGELSGAMRELAAEIKRINERLNDGDGSFDKLGERDQRIELAMAHQTRELTTFMMDRFASKRDVEVLAARIDAPPGGGKRGGQ